MSPVSDGRSSRTFGCGGALSVWQTEEHRAIMRHFASYCILNHCNPAKIVALFAERKADYLTFRGQSSEG